MTEVFKNQKIDSIAIECISGLIPNDISRRKMEHVLDD